MAYLVIILRNLIVKLMPFRKGSWTRKEGNEVGIKITVFHDTLSQFNTKDNDFPSFSFGFGTTIQFINLDVNPL
jgi:hypothetical protein